MSVGLVGMGVRAFASSGFRAVGTVKFTPKRFTVSTPNYQHYAQAMPQPCCKKFEHNSLSAKVTTTSFSRFCVIKGTFIEESVKNKIFQFRTSGYNLWSLLYPLQGKFESLSLEWQYALQSIGQEMQKVELHSYKLSLDTIKLVVEYFPNVHELNVNNTDLTNECLQEIGKLKKLKALYAKDNPQIDNNGLFLLKDAKLEVLDISRCEKINNIAFLKDQKTLKKLYCFSSASELDFTPILHLPIEELGISRKRLYSLPSFPSVKTLYLSLGNDFEGNSELEFLNRYFPNLYHLELSYGYLNQRGEAHVSSSPTLKQIFLNGKQYA